MIGIRNLFLLLAATILSTSSFAARTKQKGKASPSDPFNGLVRVKQVELNTQGSTLVAHPKEKISACLDLWYDVGRMRQGGPMHQLVIGYSSLGPQTCILHKNWYFFRENNKRIPFVLQAPSVPGTYQVLCYISHTNSPACAMLDWWEEKEPGACKIPIGEITVISP